MMTESERRLFFLRFLRSNSKSATENISTGNWVFYGDTLTVTVDRHGIVQEINNKYPPFLNENNLMNELTFDRELKKKFHEVRGH